MEKKSQENKFPKFFQKMKIIGMVTGFLMVSHLVQAQTNGSVGIGTTAPYPNAALDVSSTTKGVLFPRLSATQRATLTPLLSSATASAGLLIYNTDTKRFNYWDGTQWNDVGAGATGADGTIWYAGQGVPSNTTLGKPNDFYLDGFTGDVYAKDFSNTWVRFGGSNPVNLKNINRQEINKTTFNSVPVGFSTQTFTYMGAAVTNAVVFSPKAGFPNGVIVAYARVSAANTVEVKFYNPTAAAIPLTSFDYEIAIF
ncbi:hypothetical protein I5M32_02810 [Pedobacter sp. SD-b]|uniref:Uncharacterized protein n=1 Tax=Pedobacter segetis TaxID=2793069 RepID=A0ABS1BG76_9SPHI|nr:hypothetical protein [Pedobacter segetis]MBK0381878.1 hypothetical protein [Pedobacter segetis]